MDPVLFSRNSDEWGTPRDLFYDLNGEFHFTIDVCANVNNTKLPRYYDVHADGLTQSWKGETVFCNPPYSKIKKWVRKAYEENKNNNTTVVMLIPARTDTSYFHDYIIGKAEVRFLRGRLYFENAQGVANGQAPFPSMVVIYRERG